MSGAVDGVVVSVNVGRPRTAEWAAIGRTSIEKTPVFGPVEVDELGLDGDQVSDTRHHGGREKAVYAFAREDLAWWEGELGRPIGDGQFGENLTTRGLDVNEAEVGERWQVGEVLLEVASVRTPCNDFKAWMGRSGFDDSRWVRRFAERGRPGPYLRVLAPGALEVGDPVRVVHRPGHGVTVSTMFRALTTDRTLLPRLLAVEGLGDGPRRAAELYVAGSGGAATAGRGTIGAPRA